MISEEKILQLAWREQLNVWSREKEHYKKTESNVAKVRAERAWKELPLGRAKSENAIHDYFEEIVIVVCDTLIDEKSKLERVALKDIEIMQEGYVLNKHDVPKSYKPSEDREND